MPHVDWVWFIGGILFGMFAIPFFQAMLGRRAAKTRNVA